MLSTNDVIINFIKDNFIIIFIFLFSILKIIPGEWAGFYKINHAGEPNKITVLRFIIHVAIDSIVSALSIPLLSIFSFKPIVTILVFGVAAFDIFVRNQVSGSVITLISIGIVALYLERLVETGKNIRLFGNLIMWEKDDK